MGLQSGYTKQQCFLCEWDSRARRLHYTKKEWKVRDRYVRKQQNVIEEPLIPARNVLIPPLHLMLGLIKQFFKSLPVNEPAFTYLLKVFSKLSLYLMAQTCGKCFLMTIFSPYYQHHILCLGILFVR